MTPVLQDALKSSQRSSWRLLAGLVVAAVCAFFAWSSFAKIDEVVTAFGEVAPEGRTKIVQHLEGGIIRQLHVEEGQSVLAGDALLEIILPTTAMNPEELQVRQDGLRLTLARLAAEQAGGELVFPPDEEARRPALARAEREAFAARLTQRAESLASLTEQIRQKEFAIAEMETKQSALSADLALARQSLAISADLLRDQLTSRMEHVELQRQTRRIEGELNTVTAGVPRVTAELEEARRNFDKMESSFAREVLEEARAAEVELARTVELLVDAEEQSQRTTIRSPTNGIVKNLRYVTIGGVVSPGEAILELVPSEDRLVLEAFLSPTDRGSVSVGQRARAKITAYDFIRYGVLEGTITQIAPDTTVDSDGTAHFRVLIAPDADYLEAEGEELPIVPGMQAEVDIATGSRTILSSLLQPFTRVRLEAFRERI